MRKTHFKTLFPALLTLLLVFIPSDSSHARQVLEITSDEASLYRSPGSGQTDNRVFRGCFVHIAGPKHDGWWPVALRNGEKGYIPAWLARPRDMKFSMPPAFRRSEIPTMARPFYARTVADNIPYRSIPYGGLNAKVDLTRQGFIPYGSGILKLVGRSGHWLKAQITPAEFAWVYDESLSPALLPSSQYKKSGIALAEIKSVNSVRNDFGSSITIRTSFPVPYITGSSIEPDAVSFKLHGVHCTIKSWWWSIQCKKSGGSCRCDDDTATLEGLLPAPVKLAGYMAGYKSGSFAVTVKNTSRSPLTRIILDPGHGAPAPVPPGFASGAPGPSGCTEHTVVLAISKLVAANLRERGYSVRLTRNGTSAEMMDLYRRVALANKFGADLFVSIHANGDSDKSLTGPEIYWYDPQSQRAAETIAAAFATRSRPSVLAPYGSYAVLRQTAMPAVLVETGYLSNPSEGASLCFDDKYRKSVARSISQGIINYADTITR